MSDWRKRGIQSSGVLAVSYEMRMIEDTLQIEEECKIGHKQLEPHAGAIREFDLLDHPDERGQLVNCNGYYIRLDPFLDHLTEVYLRSLKFYPHDKLKEEDPEVAAGMILELVPDLLDPEELALQHHYFGDVDA